MNDKEIFAKNLKMYMDINGKDRNDMCNALGFNYFTFTDWIKARKMPRMDKVQKLADYFGNNFSFFTTKKRGRNYPAPQCSCGLLIALMSDFLLVVYDLAAFFLS